MIDKLKEGISQLFCVLAYEVSLYFDQQHYMLSYQPKMTDVFKMANRNQITLIVSNFSSDISNSKSDFCRNSESIQHFFNLFFAIHLVLIKRKFCGKKFFKKSKMAALGFFYKLFFHKICVLLRPNECKKKIEKMLDTLRVTSKNLILIRHFVSNCHF
jgi:hypothetical protein